MYTLSFEDTNRERSSLLARADLTEAAKNPLVPGARILRSEHAVKRHLDTTACDHWFYPLSEVNDIGLFGYFEKKACTDANQPWVVQSHPNVNLYLYIFSGQGSVILGDGSCLFQEERYDFAEEELVIIPRDTPYHLIGGFTAVSFHVRTSVYGIPAGTPRFPHPVIYHSSLQRFDASGLPRKGECLYYNPVLTRALRAPDAMECFEPPFAGGEGIDESSLYAMVTPVDEQTGVRKNIEEARKNAQVLGARVLKRSDAPAVYNANAGLKQSSYPLTWTDDIGICNLAEKRAESDIDRPFDSHSHPDIEEYKFILSGTGSVTIGVGDETCQQERYEFKAGDLVILPKGLAHLDAGGYTALYFHAKQNAFGKTAGNAMYPHVAYVYTRPPRPTKEEEAALNDPGTYILMNSRETWNIYAPNPILRAEKNQTGMTHLRPDLFEKKGE